ncbi:hypothetical protein NDU88_006174 [Pleurodeles waltl]|uniref:Uncharacterized protein n=1 Tax=Pleurodeles waltl TaxID=8319 RepID=A0AAV7NTM2_PLEWA|nr:hypothetical protein NDU88_006174 [Pleurodeles waltl]
MQVSVPVAESRQETPYANDCIPIGSPEDTLHLRAMPKERIKREIAALDSVVLGRKKSEAESGRQHGAEARSIPGWLATDPFSGVAGLLNRWAAPVLWEALDEKVTPLLVEDAVESVKLRGAKLELKAAGQVGWLFLSALCTVYRKTLTQDAEIRKLRDEVAALQERQLLIKETIESAVTRCDQMEARCTALAVRVAKQKSRQKPKIPSAVQVRALVCKENWNPYTWDGTVSDNDDD